jgi:hypothetical protein
LPKHLEKKVEGLLREAYSITGSETDAKNLVKSWTKNLMGTSTINGEKEFMMLPVSKAYPNISDEEARASLDADIKKIQPDLAPGSVKIEADELSRANPNQITYQLYKEVERDGIIIKELLTDDDGEPLRWAPSQIVREEQKKDLSGVRTLRQQALKSQQEFQNRPDTLTRLKKMINREDS